MGFIKANDEYFQSGVPVTIYIEDLNYFEKQDKLIEMHTYMTKPNSYFDPNEEVNDWYKAFMDASRSGENADTWLSADKSKFTGQTEFYAQLHSWFKDGGGARYRTFIKWIDPECDMSNTWDTCNPQLGIKATKMGGTIMLKYTLSGDERYKTLDAMRSEIRAIDAKAFPYSFNFAYWEEVGIIDVELTRNLIICACVVIFMISAMIPPPRIAVFVMLSIILSVVDLVGFLYFWDVTISSISTIYILISVGLAVDYSAHIAHMFVSASGSDPCVQKKHSRELGRAFLMQSHRQCLLLLCLPLQTPSFSGFSLKPCSSQCCLVGCTDCGFSRHFWHCLAAKMKRFHPVLVIMIWKL